MADTQTYSRDGYDAEWLALEDASGGRYYMDGDLEKQVPIFNTNFGLLATLWPDPKEPLDILDEDIAAAPYNMKCRVYKPQSSKPLPLMVFFHGGGFVAGNLDTDGPQCKIYAAKTPCVVVSVDYPLAPAYKFDAIKEAAVKSVYWACENAHRWNADPEHTIVCGGSAGAFLSSTVAYHFTSILKDYKSITGCVLLYISVGNWNYDGPHKEKYVAWTEMADGDQPMLNRPLFEDVAKFWELDFHSPAHFPMLDSDLSKFPPCYIVSAEKDILRDDGVVFDLRLKDEGIRSKFDLYKALPHWFHAFPQLTASHVMLDKTVKGIQWLLSGEP